MVREEPREHHGMVIDRVSGYAVLDCESCGFRHLDPIPGEEESRDFYDNQYFQHVQPDALQEDQQEIEHRKLFFDQRLRFLQAGAPGRRLLDVGCGDGSFLSRAREEGWSTEGIEPSSLAATHARNRGLSVTHGTLEQYPVRTGEQFDVVHLKNVLEHVPDPSRALRTCHQLLAPGGILYIEVPNDYDPCQRLGVWMLGERKSWIAVPDHINYFNFRSAEKLVRKTGFTTRRRDTTFPMYLFLCLGLNFIKDKSLGKRLHRWRVRFELFCAAHGLDGIRHLAYRAMANCGLGRTVILYCRKSGQPSNCAMLPAETGLNRC